MMHGRGKSDGPVVPTKLPNNAGTPAAEAVEGRGPAKGNTPQPTASRTQSRNHGASDSLERVRHVARRSKDERFTALLHHVTVERLRVAFGELKRRAAPGVDGVTWEAYAEALEDNLRDLHDRLQRGAYRAKPSRRVLIPKADGGTRALGIASLEDKIVQRSVVQVLNTIYEEDFLGFSYGFRPGRSPHHALDALAVGIRTKKVNWVLDADIRGFFDTIDHGWLARFLEHRIADRRMVRLIQKWLNAGVLHDGAKSVTEVGSPQGATISPLLANIYLHYVFDLWAQRWRAERASADMIVVRYADDFVVGFQRKSDAVKFQSELQDRLRTFALELHPDKTRLIQFGKMAATFRAEDGLGRPETFAFLGFTHICGRSLRGKWILLRHTEKRRMRATLKAHRGELKRRRHLPIPAQGAWIATVVRGYFAYYAVPTNIPTLESFRAELIRAWLHALRRRSQRHRMNWARMSVLATRWIPKARVLHLWPEQRLGVTTQGKSPVR